MSFILLVNILLSEEDCQALHKDPSETVVAPTPAVNVYYAQGNPPGF